MATTTEQHTIDLSRYAKTYKSVSWRNTGGLCLRGFQTGQRAAREIDIKSIRDKPIYFIGPIKLIKVDSKFLSGLLGPTVRALGIEKAAKLITGDSIIQDALGEFFGECEMRVLNREKQAEIEKRDPKWSKSISFLVPDIGTVVRLDEAWEFRLHREHRNYGLMEVLGLSHAESCRGRLDEQDTSEAVILSKGTILKVARIYIRKGARKYSSITFNIQKGPSEATCGKKAVNFTKKGVRFWAKLSDVNMMSVSIDKSTLAEN